MQRPRVILADSDEPVRVGLRGALKSAGFEIRGEPVSAEEALAQAHRERPDLCLIDVALAGGGITVAARIARELPACAIVMLAAQEDELEVIDAVRVGASGYLLKGMDPTRLGPALRGVMDGEAAVPRRLTAKVRGRGQPVEVDGLRIALSQREREVLDLLGDELSVADMAERLGISPVTVRRHISGLMRKLRAPDRATLRRRAAEQRRAPG